jgi:purine-binding chemotaxis protein CheW
MVEKQIEAQVRTRLLTTFFVRDTLCAFDAAGVQEVIRVGAVTPVRHAPDEVTGVINLRGRIVTLVDLGSILGFGRSTVTRDSRIFIIEDRNEFLGVLVDRVSEVVEADATGEDTLPANIPPGQARLFNGVCRATGRLIALLNSSEVLREIPV